MDATSTEDATLAQALLKFQQLVTPISKSKTVKVKTQRGGDYTFSYAPYEAIVESIKPHLAECDLAVAQPLDANPEGHLFVKTILMHVTGESLVSVAPINTANMSMQEVGSAITYMRRYALSALLGLVTDEDDDANMADGNKAEVVTRRTLKPLTTDTVSPESQKELEAFAAKYNTTWDEAIENYAPAGRTAT